MTQYEFSTGVSNGVVAPEQDNLNDDTPDT